MDNDSIIKKKLVRLYRGVRERIDYFGMNYLSEEEGNLKISGLLDSSDPFMVGRLGAVEMRCVSKWMKGMLCNDSEKKQALYAAGIFPNNDATISQFCEVYTDAMKSCDLLGVWEVVGEKKAISLYCDNPILMPSRSIESYYFDNPWSENLKNKRILIVHPFVQSIKYQLNRRESIWPGKNVLPLFKSVQYVKSVQSNAGAHTSFQDWFEALAYMKKQIDFCDFDVAIIGAGAYGLPLAAHVKSIGKQAIQMSGATQILFGIKGKRWDNHPVISKFYNESWVRPNSSETPLQKEKVEGGSYW